MGDPVKDWFCCWRNLLYGRACVFYNILFSPFVLCLWANSIYTAGCLRVYWHRTWYKVCCLCCRVWNCCWLYTDKSFPPDKSSLGKLGGDRAAGDAGKMKQSVVWLRANQFTMGGRMQLFSNKIDANDICQGALGNCWLLAAMACLAEHEGAIPAIFRTKERNPTGRYHLRLYDGVQEKWENVIIDDHIPCDRDRYEKEGVCRPVFSQPNGNELWAMLLEKAFAKFCGSYAATEGGQTIWAIRAMTGDPARCFMRADNRKDWNRQDLVNMDEKDDRRACGLRVKGEKIDNAVMFDILLKYHKLGSILCASKSSGKGGLHQGHAYSILDVRKVSSSGRLSGMMGGETFRLIKVRNPWGSGEWKGDWSDDSALWKKYPKVASAVGFEDVDDGAFWMCWADFVENWGMIGVIDRTIDINSLRLPIRNDFLCSPVAAWFKGCFRFWCCCLGPKRLYCPHRSSSETVKVKKRCFFW